MRSLIIPFTFAIGFAALAGTASALPGGSIGTSVKPAESDVVQVHKGPYACHLTRRGWKRDTKPYSKPCPRHHRYRCWGHSNCWYRL